MSLFGVFPKVRPYSLLNWDAERYPTRRLAMPASIIVESIRRPASRSSTYRWSSFPGQVSEIEMPGSGARRTALRQQLQVREEMMLQTLGIGAAAVRVGEGERVSPAPGTVHRSPGEGLARIETRALRKVYVLPRGRRRRGGPNGAPGGGGPAPVAGAEAPREIVALEGLDLDVPSGEFFGLLGPNGAGKTTTIGILTTRVRPTSGGASVGGVSVVEDPVGVRRRIGVVPQRPNPDRVLTALENLVYHATYFGIGLGEAMTRARAARPLRALATGRRQGGPALRRAAAAPDGRACAHPRPDRALPRRADGRPRSSGAPRPVGHPADAPRRGPDHRPHDSLHGGSGPAMRAARHRRPRAAAGTRHARRAEVTSSRRDARGADAGRRRRRSACGGRGGDRDDTSGGGRHRFAG